MAQAVKEIKDNYSQDEHLTLLVFRNSYNSDEQQALVDAARSFNPRVSVLYIDSRDLLIDYFNHQAIEDSMVAVFKGGVKESRQTPNSKNEIVLIGNVKIFSHGLPSRFTFDLGMGGDSNEASEFNRDHVTLLSPESFAKDGFGEIYSYACRTGNASDNNVFSPTDWKKEAKPKESLAQKLADHLGIKVYAYVKRSNYRPTFDDGGDEFYKKNFVEIPDNTVVQMDPERKSSFWPGNWNEVLWNKLGANKKVGEGASPEGIPQSGMYVFEKGEDPKPRYIGY